MNFFQDLRRRRMFRLVGLYIVGAWVVIQVAEALFQAWGIPETAMRFVFIAAFLCFPIALVFGWIFDITSEGIVRTKKADSDTAVRMDLQKTDFAILAALAAIGIVVMLGSVDKIQEEIESGHTKAAGIDAPVNSIAVLPFRNLDINAQTGYFSDGITEEILHRLSTLGALHVLASNSSFSFRDNALPPKEVSKALGVRYLLDGSIRRSADFVRVTARLLDDSGYQVWSETFDRELTEIFVVQSEIARSVSQEIVNEIVPLQATPAGRTTDNMEAYNQYLLGRHAAQTRTWDWKDMAEAAFDKAIELDPDFAPPYAGLATLVVNTNRGPHWDDALEQAEKALALDPELADGHAIHGLITTVLGDAAAGAASLSYALELDPSLSMAYNWLYVALERQGRTEESRAVRDRGLEVDPLNPSLVANTAADEAMDGNFDRAEQLLLRIASLPDISGPATSILSLYENWSRYDKLVDLTMRFAVKLSSPEPEAWTFQDVARAYARLGMTSDADFWWSQAIAIEPDLATDMYGIHYLFKFYGDREQIRAAIDGIEPDEKGRGVEIYASQLGYGSLAHVNAENFGKAAEWAEMSLELFQGLYDPGTPLHELDVGRYMANWGDGLVFEFFQHLAFAYQQLDRHDDADQILRQVGVFLDSREAKDPLGLEQRALQSILQSDIDRAYEYLSAAVDIGWANYYEITNDPAWAAALPDDRIVELLDVARTRVEAQRVTVEAAEDSAEFQAMQSRMLGE